MTSSRSEDEDIYGYAVHCEFRTETGNGYYSKTFRSKGKSQTKAERTPIFKRGFVKVTEIEPFTRLQWLRVFGEGKM